MAVVYTYNDSGLRVQNGRVPHDDHAGSQLRVTGRLGVRHEDCMAPGSFTQQDRERQ